MIEINTKFGKIFIEDINFCDPSENLDYDDKVRLFDSENRYLNYIENETLLDWAETENISLAEAVERHIKEIESCETIEDLLGKVIEGDYAFYSKDWEEVAHFMQPLCIDEYLTPESLLGNEWVNKIGDYYIVVEEN